MMPKPTAAFIASRDAHENLDALAALLKETSDHLINGLYKDSEDLLEIAVLNVDKATILLKRTSALVRQSRDARFAALKDQPAE